MLTAASHSVEEGQVFRPDIEGLRAIAVVLVLLYHAQLELFSGGFVGVDIFFVLSGFLITRSLLEEAARGRVSLPEFYGRRIRRLLPAAAVTLVATAVGVALLLPVTTWRDFGGDIAASAGYVVNWRLAARSVDYLAEGVAASPVQHFWSLAVEEQFYLVWPALIALALTVARRREWSLRWTVGVVLASLVAIPSLLWSVLLTSQDSARAFFVTTTRLWELAVGGLVAVALPWISVRIKLVRVVTKVMALAVIAWAGVFIDGGDAWPGSLAVIPVVATALLLLVGHPGDPTDRFLSLAPMQTVGRLSYSLYLWHWPLVAILAAKWGEMSSWTASAVVAASVLPAWICHRTVENPIRYSQVLRASVRSTVAVGTGLTLAGLLAGGALALGASAAGTNPLPEPAAGAEVLVPGLDDSDLLAMLAATETVTPAPVDAPDDLPALYADGCQISQTQTTPVVCEYGDAEGEKTLALVGDSKAAQWSSAFVEVAERHQWRVTTMTKSACGLSTSFLPRPDGPYVECFEWGEAVVDLLLDDPPDLVVVSQGGSTASFDDEEPSQGAMVEGMIAAYEPLTAAGIEVLILVDNPHPGFTVYECVAEHADDLEACTFEKGQRLSSGGRDAQQEVARRGGYATIDLLDGICPTDICLPVIGDVLVYRQGSHLTDTYVRSLTEKLDGALRSILPSAYFAIDT